MGAAAVIAGVIRGVVALLRTPLLKDVWQRLPWWAKPSTLLGATVVLGTLDAFGFGQPWYLAVGSAITGLGGAVVSHEWQALFKEAMAEKAAEEAEAKKTAAPTAVDTILPDHTPPSGIHQVDTIPDGKPTGSDPLN
jgi:hypothetical protein